MSQASSPISYSTTTLAVKGRSRANVLRKGYSCGISHRLSSVPAKLLNRPEEGSKGNRISLGSCHQASARPAVVQSLSLLEEEGKREQSQTGVTAGSHVIAGLQPHVRIFPVLHRGFAEEGCTLLAYLRCSQSTNSTANKIYTALSCLLPSFALREHCFLLLCG